MENKMYCCIDLKSFYASVECVERGLDPFKANLVVADPSRNDGTICLAISPAMKALGVKNRCRLYEIPKNINYVIAKPRMRLYMERSAEIYETYLKYISPEDVLVYSIDECFFDLTDYVKLYNKTATGVAKMLIDEVFKKTGICATVGIGTNMFLAKVALDITAKHSPDFMGFLDEEEFKKTIWHHRPITDIWNVGRGIANRLSHYGIFDLYGVAHCDEKLLYKEFGVNAELLIDHAHGIEPCTIADVHSYKAKTASLSNSQILFNDYDKESAFTVIKEMVDAQTLELVEKGLVTNSISLYIGYSKNVIKPTGGTMKLNGYTSSYKKLISVFKNYFEKTVNSNYPIRKITIGLNNVVDKINMTYDLFTDVKAEEKERSLQKTVLDIKDKFGKNSILKGTSFEEKATARERNKMIGGHNSGEDE